MTSKMNLTSASGGRPSRRGSNPSVSGVKSFRKGNNIRVGLLLWGRIPSSPWWPGIVVSYEDCGLKPPKQSAVWFFWLGDYRVSEVLLSQLQPFAKQFSKLFDKQNKGVRLNTGIHEAIKIYAAESGESDCELWNFTDSVSWILGIPKHLLEPKFRHARGSLYDFPEFVHSKLLKLKLQNLELERNRTEDERNNEEEEVNNNQSKKLKASLEITNVVEEPTLKSAVIDKIKCGLLSLENICLCCVQKKTNLNHEHPFFLGKVCDQCFEEIKDTVFAIGDDGVHFHCVVCTQRGEVFICDNSSCRRVFCFTCIKVFCPDKTRAKIAEKDPWKCFLCSDYDKELNGFLTKQENWPANVANMYITSKKLEVIPSFQKRPLRVLSLFDGIGTGLCVLNKLNLELEVYYASEVDEDAINLTVINHGSKITHLGRIESLTTTELLKLMPIDLLIGGSPCNDLSGVNPARKGIYDPSGTGILYFDFYRVLEFLKKDNNGRHLFWLYENVTSMTKNSREVITRFFECDPAVVDAKHFSAQNRSRFFWGNIPSLKSAQQTAMDIENCPELNSVLTKNCNRQAVVKTVRTITTNSNSLRQGKESSLPVSMNGKGDTLWVTEMEELFGFSRHYTDIGYLSATKRLRLLGKSWSIPVMCHILKPLTAFYSCVDSESG